MSDGHLLLSLHNSDNKDPIDLTGSGKFLTYEIQAGEWHFVAFSVDITLSKALLVIDDKVC